jgi:multidrug resistance efflux pump
VELSVRAMTFAREAAARAPGFLRRRPRPWLVAAAALGVALAGLLVSALFHRGPGEDPLAATVRRSSLSARLTLTGVLRPAQSLTYRSPLAGREAEVVFLAPEGTLVGEGDLLARLDATELERELLRAVQDFRQAQVDLKVAEAERAEGQAAVESMDAGEGALGVEEARSQLAFAERKAKRLRDAYEANRPLLEQGFLTKDELDRSAFEMEQAEAELALARKKAQVFIERTHPRNRQRARVTLSQREAQAENARARLEEARFRMKRLQEDIEGCSLYARAAGLVVHEEHLGASPRRKVRTGDRVTGSQGLVTIPEVRRMMIEASADEAEVHRLKPGQPAAIRLDAFPDLRLTGRVARVGTLARTSVERPYEDKKFDLVVDVDPSDADLRPEMTARVDVLLSERAGVLVVPVNAVFDRQGIVVAHVLRGFRTETRQVELGETDGVMAEVRGGLEEGDRVALADVGTGQAVAPSPSATPAVRSFERAVTEAPSLAPR